MRITLVGRAPGVNPWRPGKELRQNARTDLVKLETQAIIKQPVPCQVEGLSWFDLPYPKGRAARRQPGLQHGQGVAGFISSLEIAGFLPVDHATRRSMPNSTSLSIGESRLAGVVLVGLNMILGDGTAT
jgi:hypothetical protein